jgi:Ca2+-binding RTX toxin-like protein
VTTTVVNGVSTAQNDDLIIISRLHTGVTNVAHWVGQYHFEGGIPTPDAGTTPQLISSRNIPYVSSRSTVEVYAGDGNDIVINFTTIPCRLFGGAGDDQLFGGLGNDMIFGDLGSDIIAGLSGDDYLYGDEWVRGSNPFIYPGNDFLIGNDGSDHLFGEYGNDVLCGGNSPTDNDDVRVDYLNGNTYFVGRWESDTNLDVYFLEAHHAGPTHIFVRDVAVDYSATFDYQELTFM